MDKLQISCDGAALQTLLEPRLGDGDAIRRPLAVSAGLGEPRLDLWLELVQEEEDVLRVSRDRALINLADLASRFFIRGLARSIRTTRSGKSSKHTDQIEGIQETPAGFALITPGIWVFTAGAGPLDESVRCNAS